MTVPAAPMAGDHISTASRLVGTPLLQQPCQVRVERVAPSREVVSAGCLMQCRVIPLSTQRPGHHAVVVNVLLGCAAGEDGAHGTGRGGPQHVADESDDPPVLAQASPL